MKTRARNESNDITSVLGFEVDYFVSDYLDENQSRWIPIKLLESRGGNGRFLSTASFDEDNGSVRPEK